MEIGLVLLGDIKTPPIIQTYEDRTSEAHLFRSGFNDFLSKAKGRTFRGSEGFGGPGGTGADAAEGGREAGWREAETGICGLGVGGPERVAAAAASEDGQASKLQPRGRQGKRTSDQLKNIRKQWPDVV